MMCGARHGSKRQPLVGTDHRIGALPKGDITGLDLQDVGGYLSPLSDNLAGGNLESGSPHGNASRTERAGSERNEVCITFDDFDLVEGKSKLRSKDLCQSCCMALTMAVGAEHGRKAAIGMNADGG